MTTTLDAQTFLIGRGYYIGSTGADGILGRYTQRAIRSWQRSNRLRVTGVLDDPTLVSMDLKLSDEDTATLADVPHFERPLPPWYELAMRKKGLHEGRDKIELSQFLKSDGKTLGDPTKLPWCGDYVETCIGLTLPSEPMVTNPYLARNWLKFGQKVTPTIGAIMVFWRGKKSGYSGHVAFYVGESAGTYTILGGNQSNRISVTAISKSRFLGARWPLTYPRPGTGIVELSAVGPLSQNEE